MHGQPSRKDLRDADFWLPGALRGSSRTARYLHREFSVMWPDEQPMRNVPASYVPTLAAEFTLTPATEIPYNPELRRAVATYVDQLLSDAR